MNFDSPQWSDLFGILIGLAIALVLMAGLAGGIAFLISRATP